MPRQKPQKRVWVSIMGGIGGRTARQGFTAMAVLAFAAFIAFCASPARAASSQLLLASVEGGQDVVEFNVDRLPKWQRIRDWLVSPTAAASDPALRPWSAWARSLRNLPVSERLDSINRRVNGSFRYATDLEVWGVRDYWETPSEVVQKGATDCEGFAIMKLWLAREAGVDDGRLKLLVGVLSRSGQMHAVLLTADESGPVVLDVLHPAVMTAAYLGDFRPIAATDLSNVSIFLRARGDSAVLALR
jgi:predicted transglutaminase-like cysteine proteinase